MRFTRYEIRKGPREWTPRKVAAAARSARRFTEREAVPLFPEMSRTKTADDRVAEVDRDHAAFVIKHRAWQAVKWREARAKLRALPAITKLGLIKLWNLGICPAGIIRESKHTSPWTKLRERHQLKEAGRKWRAANNWK